MADYDGGPPAAAGEGGTTRATPPARGAAPGGASGGAGVAAGATALGGTSPEPSSDGEEAEADGDDDGEAGESEPASPPADGSPESGTDGPGGGRKKKKKKRVRKPAGAAGAAAVVDGGNNTAASAASPPAAATDPGADSRFASGLEQLRGGSLWCALAGAGVTDKRVKTLVDAMRSPATSVTSLDLSGNRVTDAGAAALAAALGGGLAPDLIALNVAGNPLTETGRAALQSLARLRRGLDVTLVVPDIVPPLPNTPPPAAGAGRPRLPHTGKGQASGMASRFFGASDDGDGGAPDARGAIGPARGVRLASAASALDAAQAALSCASAAVAGAAAGEDGALRPAALGAALFAAVGAVEEELLGDAESMGGAMGIAVQQPSYPSLSALPPATRTLAQGGEVLVAVLALVPPPLPWQGGAGPRPCVGTHRLAALLLLARFVQLGCAELDALLAAQELLPRTVALMFTHTGPSAVHAAAARLIQAALGSACTALWLPAFQPGPHGPPLQARLAEAGVEAAPLLPGRRATHVGAVIAVANGLRALQEGPAAGCPPALRTALDDDAAWCAFADCELAQLNEQQAGTLCGPKPARPPPPFAAAQAGGAGGAGSFGSLLGGSDLMPSGRGLLAMLQTLGRMSTQG